MKTRFFQRQTVAYFLALLVFSVGLVNVASALWALSPGRAEILETIIPFDISNASRTLTLLTGLFLVILARGLWGRKRRAWGLSVFLISISLILHLAKGLDIEESLLALFPLSALLVFRSEFTVQSGRIEFFSGLRNAMLILTLLFLYATIGFFALDGQFNQPVSLSAIGRDYEYSIFGTGRDTLVPKTPRARWFEDSLTAVGIAALFVVLATLFSPALSHGEATEEERSMVDTIILSDGANAVSYLALMPDKQYFFSQTKRSVLAFTIRRGVALTLGGPIGDESESEFLINEFQRAMTQKGLLSAFYNLTEDERSACETIGMKTVKIGEEAVLDVQSFSLYSPELKDVRNATTRMIREGVSYEWTSLADVSWTVMSKVDALHRWWLSLQKAPPLTFSVDFYPFPPEKRGFLLTASGPNGSLWGAFSFFPYNNKNGLILDLMLRSPDAPNGIVEAAIAHAVDLARVQGITELNLSMAPLSDINPSEHSALVNRRTRILFNALNRVYRYRSLFAFKKKFHPTWRPKYLAYQRDFDIPKIGFALVAAHLKNQSLVGVLRKLVQS